MCSLCERATVECAEDGRVKEANVMLPLCKASSGGGWVQHRKIPEEKATGKNTQNHCALPFISFLEYFVKRVSSVHFLNFFVKRVSPFDVMKVEDELAVELPYVYVLVAGTGYDSLVPMITSKFGLQYKDIKVGGRRSPPVGFQVAANYVAVVPSSQIFDRILFRKTC
ncbi:Peptidyl-prolyl cis-trans isomerase FKBP16-3, chloroplastic [Sesamum angolense]|uniref:Peptidyl-prolyl cis-trans isomerase FKBP16-3, chloroplastic n=1 Tax=Sesamum angolense TaxID=2727404 RepID=A0AAE1T1I4_9LAMI|nr:Peptidyl-prolyl cis-trans isomerase FKBP16-3, chloroplastic [Sesamum angolense]